MCGIIAHIGNVKNKVNIDKLNILGILNETRGKDSCGITMDGKILKGVDSLKVYRDFVAVYNLTTPEKGTGVIGHTRHATYGSHTLANTHPFGFGKLKIPGFKQTVFEFVGVHNGTLINHTELAKEGGVNVTKTITKKTVVGTGANKTETLNDIEVTKIDSEVLLERLYKDKDYRVLSEYNGAAALVWQDMNKPNTMFFWHGKSVKEIGDKEPEEERPLYYWKENKNSLYVSSIMDSLYVIGGNEDTIGEFKHNTVYEVKNGDISRAKKTEIDRSKNYIKKSYNVSNHNRSRSNFPAPREGENSSLRRPYKAKPLRELTSSQQTSLNLELPVDKGLLKEEFDFNPNLNKGITMCKQLRHFKNGHLANGVFAFIPKNGFYLLGYSQKAALKELEDLKGKYFYNKSFHVEKPSDKSITMYFVPFTVANVDNNSMAFLHYFVDGIRMKTYIDYKAISQLKDEGKHKFDLVALSMAAAHPIIDIRNGADRTSGAYYNGTLADTNFSFLGSFKTYTFKAGQITSIKYIRGMIPPELVIDEKKPAFNTLQSAANFLENASKVNGYIDLKKTELLKELVSLDDVLDVLKISKQKTIKKVSDRIEMEVDSVIVAGLSEPNPDFKDMRNELFRYKSGSTRAEIAVRILTELSELEDES